MLLEQGSSYRARASLGTVPSQWLGRIRNPRFKKPLDISNRNPAPPEIVRQNISRYRKLRVISILALATSLLVPRGFLIQLGGKISRTLHKEVRACSECLTPLPIQNGSRCDIYAAFRPTLCSRGTGNFATKLYRDFTVGQPVYKHVPGS